MIELCHKCYGQVSGRLELYGCSCISPGGGVKASSVEQATTLQAKRQLEFLALYVSQGRGESFPISALVRAVKLSPCFGHGTVDWAALTEAKKNDNET